MADLGQRKTSLAKIVVWALEALVSYAHDWIQAHIAGGSMTNRLLGAQTYTQRWMRGALKVVIGLYNGSKTVMRVWGVREATAGVAKVKVVAILTFPTGATDGTHTMVAVHIQMDR